MRFASICSGIEAASVAWHPLGWDAAWLAEVDPFCRSLLEHRYPGTPNLGDVTQITDEEARSHGTVDVFVGGTPCQSFSVAGQRGGMDDARGELALALPRLAHATGARWLVWENVPGVLSSNGGRDFGAFLWTLEQFGYGWAYRTLDAQHFGVAQRRRRVFVVGHAGGLWQRAAAVLFERASLSGHPAPRREARAATAGATARSARGGSNDGHRVAHTPRAEGFDASEDGTGRGSPLVADEPAVYQCHGSNVGPMGTLRRGNGNASGGVPFVAVYGGNNTSGQRSVAAALTAKGGTGRQDFETENFVCFNPTQVTSAENRSNPQPGDPVHCLSATADAAVAFNARQDPDVSGDRTHPLDTDGCSIAAATGAGVRRLTPREWERLQGFPDDYTLVPYRGAMAKDGPRYRALGNSMAVPVMRWIGERIELVDRLVREEVAA